MNPGALAHQGTLEKEGHRVNPSPHDYISQSSGVTVTRLRGRSTLHTGRKALPGLGQEVEGWPLPWFLVVGPRELGE